jgi:hypothetical protein
MCFYGVTKLSLADLLQRLKGSSTLILFVLLNIEDLLLLVGLHFRD